MFIPLEGCIPLRKRVGNQKPRSMNKGYVLPPLDFRVDEISIRNQTYDLVSILQSTFFGVLLFIVWPSKGNDSAPQYQTTERRKDSQAAEAGGGGVARIILVTQYVLHLLLASCQVYMPTMVTFWGEWLQRDVYHIILCAQTRMPLQTK